jgi:hypothetical protein
MYAVLSMENWQKFAHSITQAKDHSSGLCEIASVNRIFRSFAPQAGKRMVQEWERGCYETRF